MKGRKQYSLKKNSQPFITGTSNYDCWLISVYKIFTELMCLQVLYYKEN